VFRLLYLSPLLQILALVHFFKRGSGNYMWFFLIIFLGPVGAIVYLIVEVLPELRAPQSSTNWFARRRRVQDLEAVVLDNPSAGNFEELADLYLEDKNYARARECFDRSISTRTDIPHPFYGRARCALALGDVKAAIPDLEKVVSMDRNHDYHRAMGLLAFCYGENGQAEAAEKLFREALATSTLSETQFHFARFLAAQGKTDEAREWAQRILSKRSTVSAPLRRADSEWFSRAKALLHELGSAPSRPNRAP